MIFSACLILGHWQWRVLFLLNCPRRDNRLTTLSFQGTPTKAETPGKVEKKAEDKENIYSAAVDQADQPSSLVNETFGLEKDALTFGDLSDQLKGVEMASEAAQDKG